MFATAQWLWGEVCIAKPVVVLGATGCSLLLGQACGYFTDVGQAPLCMFIST